MAPQLSSTRAYQIGQATKGDVTAPAPDVEFDYVLDERTTCDVDFGDICIDSSRRSNLKASVLPRTRLPNGPALPPMSRPLRMAELGEKNCRVSPSRPLSFLDDGLKGPLKASPPFLRKPSNLAVPPQDSLLVSTSISCPPQSYSFQNNHGSFTHQCQPASLSARRTELGSAGRFAPELCPGDVLSIIDDSFTISRLGTAGGYMGHVLLVVSAPRLVEKRSEVGQAFRELWLSGARNLFMVGIVECCRSGEGLTEVDLILSVNDHGEVHMCGECSCDGGDMFLHEDFKEAHIWHSPSHFRGENFCLDVMQIVLEDMRSNQQNWSWATAVRAFFFSGELSTQSVASITMKEIEDSWKAEPICTSVVVVFWQRYLQKLAALESTDALQLVLQFMPLRADRVLPTTLQSTMLARGWSLWHSGTHGHETRNGVYTRRAVSV